MLWKKYIIGDKNTFFTRNTASLLPDIDCSGFASKGNKKNISSNKPKSPHPPKNVSQSKAERNMLVKIQ